MLTNIKNNVITNIIQQSIINKGEIYAKTSTRKCLCKKRRNTG